MSFLSFLKKLFDSNVRELKRLVPLQQAVLAFEAPFKKLDDGALAAKTGEFRERIANGEDLDKVLPEAFAVVREVAARVLDMRPFPVQVLGAIVLHQGRIAEMQTGEGKTLVATLPSYLNAVGGRTVHVVTVNDYLARRDREWMGQIHRFLGLDVGLVVPQMDAADKRRSYSCPIVYGTNSEFGFDYLRDNMAWQKEDVVQGPLDYGIIDEVDSILIDEARTPLIISGPSEGSTEVYKKFRDLSKVLKKDRDYTVDEKARLVVMTDEGDRRAEDWLGVAGLESEENLELHAYISQALRAKELMRRDIDYVVKDGEVLIVDEFTGRILPGRRYSDGLHQAIEAKEGVNIREEADTLATITVQNYFRMYKKLAGMTGTALTEEPEFREIYGLDVVSIPTNKPLVRDTMDDSIWKTEAAKYKAAAEEICQCYEMGRPVLVGTRSIEKSELVSEMLRRKGVPHEVLNAKHHSREAEIVAQAGRKGSVTIATNMAGRGTDILLGGNPEFLARRALRQEDYSSEAVLLASEKALPENLSARLQKGDTGEDLQEVVDARVRYAELYKEWKEKTDAEHDEVVGLGGLHVLGTERHEARRIDNQLRGRAGRQGDPGSSRFYLSLEDELMRLFGGEALSGLMDRIGFTEDDPIEHSLVSKSVEGAQKRIEAHNFGIRKSVLEYDNVLNRQREVIYGERRTAMFQDDLAATIWEMVLRVLDLALNLYWPQNAKREEADVSSLSQYLREVNSAIPDSLFLAAENRDSLETAVKGAFRSAFEEKLTFLGEEANGFLKAVLLSAIDHHWVNQLGMMVHLREGIGLQAYGQRDPLVEYTKQGYEMFQGRIQNIERDTVRLVFRGQPRREGAGATPAPVGRRSVSTPGTSPGQGAKKADKVGRNSPCPCGSGKKYKNCCGKVV